MTVFGIEIEQGRALLVATRKGLFTLQTDAKRLRWNLCEPLFLGHIINHAVSGTDPAHYLSSDNDPLFRFHRWTANLRILDVTEFISVPYVPKSHPFIERVIGTIRRDYLDHVPFWNSISLERELRKFKAYYNNYRTHTALAG